MRFINLIIFVIFYVSCSSPYKGPKSDNFNGEVFYYKKPLNKSFSDLIKWKITGEAKKWPDYQDYPTSKIEKSRNSRRELSATFINHSTLLIQIDGINILTDPIYSDRTSPVSFAGPKRVRNPGVKFEDLPKIDIVLISHNHYDHLDIKTLKRISDRDQALIVAGLGNDYLLKRKGIQNIKTVDWYQPFEERGIEIQFLPCQHWSARGVFDRNHSLWGSYSIKGEKHSIYFAGDTGYGEFFKEIGDKEGPFDLALIPIGAYEPRWFMKEQHINPEEAVQAHIDLKSKFSIGIHFGTFQLTDEGIDDPLKALNEAKTKYFVDNFIAPEFGRSYSIP